MTCGSDSCSTPETKRRQRGTTGCLNSTKKEETWLDAEEVVLSGDKLEEPVVTEAARLSETDQRTEANTSPVNRWSKREVKLPNYLKDFQLN